MLICVWVPVVFWRWRVSVNVFVTDIVRSGWAAPVQFVAQSNGLRRWVDRKVSRRVWFWSWPLPRLLADREGVQAVVSRVDVLPGVSVFDQVAGDDVHGLQRAQFRRQITPGKIPGRFAGVGAIDRFGEGGRWVRGQRDSVGFAVGDRVAQARREPAFDAQHAVEAHGLRFQLVVARGSCVEAETLVMVEKMTSLDSRVVDALKIRVKRKSGSRLEGQSWR